MIDVLDPNIHVILASSSPRRKEYLSWICSNFDCISPDIEEISLLENPIEIVNDLALQKGDCIWNKIQDDENISTKKLLIISSDTIVSMNNKIYGKPQNNQKAYQMLVEFAGKIHQVHTSVSFIYKKSKNSTVERRQLCISSQVEFAPLEECNIFIKNYANSEDPLDKAGSYGIQGYPQVFIKNIQGSLGAIIGLPVYEVTQELVKINQFLLR